MLIDPLNFDVQYLKGVGPGRAALLASELGVRTLKDLLYTFPYKYIDRSVYYTIRDLQEGMAYVQVKGQIINILTEGEGRKRRLKAIFSDGTGLMDLVWFNGLKYVEKQIKIGRPYVAFGTPTLFGGRFSMSHPELTTTEQPLQTGLSAYYHTTDRMKRAGLTSHALSEMVAAAFALLDRPIDETLPPYLLRSERLEGLDAALRHIHHPANEEQVVQARRRLKFEELFYVQLGILHYAKMRQLRLLGQPCPRVGAMFNSFYREHLPFALTGAQKRVMHEIHRDMSGRRQMNRLLQGDVGSGKTVVALMSILLAIDNGRQACFMAPTEILAEQHYHTLARMLSGLPVTIALLTGAVKGKRRTEVLDACASGRLNILVGTHAVLEDNVQFLSLGLAVIDEQHRFGVAQRAKLWTKSERPPHVLVMTATPIPRTLAMTLYGDLDVSVLDELPPGRHPIKTVHVYNQRKADLYDRVRTELRAGRQVYWAFPLIKESEKSDLLSLEQGFESLRQVFAEYRVAKLHGQMKSAEKEAVMRDFQSGRTQVLVSTTVIEVGVDVPNASVMVIEEAQRFGLAQLHQLRGRVGRGAEQSYCVLITPYAMSEATRRRIAIMVETTDGFRIAEEDLNLRGPGDLEGTQQSGLPFELKVANLARDGALLTHAREVAQTIVEADPTASRPENALLWQQLRALRRDQVNWSAIS